MVAAATLVLLEEVLGVANECSTLFGHTSFVRAVAVDELGQTLYSGSDDRRIKIWQSR